MNESELISVGLNEQMDLDSNASEYNPSNSNSGSGGSIDGV